MFAHLCDHAILQRCEMSIYWCEGSRFTSSGTLRTLWAPRMQVQNKRACAVSYPTREAEGLLWIWAHAGPGGEQEAAAADWRGLAGVVDEKGPSAFSGPHRWYYRQVCGQPRAVQG